EGCWRLVSALDHDGWEPDPVLAELDVADVGERNRNLRPTGQIAGTNQASGGQYERADGTSPVLRRADHELILTQLEPAGQPEIGDRRWQGRGLLRRGEVRLTSRLAVGPVSHGSGIHLFHLAGAEGRGGDAIEVAVDGGFHRGDDGALHEGRIAEQHATGTLRELLDRHLGAEHRAAQVDEHQHAVRPADLLDRTRDGGGIGAEPAVSGPTGDRDLDLALGQLGRELGDAIGELPAG